MVDQESELTTDLGEVTFPFVEDENGNITDDVLHYWVTPSYDEQGGWYLRPGPRTDESIPVTMTLWGAW